MKTLRFKLFANCVRSEGYNRAIIFDLQRNAYYLVPKSLYGLFDENDVMLLDYKEFAEEEIQILNEYVSFLLERELIFPVDEDEINQFPKLNLEWSYPSIITNMIVDIRDIEINWKNLVNQMEELKCYFIQIRFFKSADIEYLKRLLDVFYSSLIGGVELLVGYNVDISTDAYIELLGNNHKLKSLIIYDAPGNETVSHPTEGFNGIFYISEKISSHKNCGVILPSYFTINIETYTESQKHNTCLNRKLSIDENGEIKNCPSQAKSYGNINNTRLVDVANNSEFQKLWHITKDSVLKCKDCEFRYVCSDCRTFLDNPQDIYSAPLKCGYNPYTCEWEDWASNPLKVSAINHYQLSV